MPNLLARPVELGELHRNAPGCPDTRQRSVWRRSEDNHAVAIPRAAGPPRGVTQGLWRAAQDVHFLQLTAGKERDEAAVGGPERKERAFAAGHGLCIQPI